MISTKLRTILKQKYILLAVKNGYFPLLVDNKPNQALGRYDKHVQTPVFDHPREILFIILVELDYRTVKGVEGPKDKPTHINFPKSTKSRSNRNEMLH